ncbi:hypothetical protein OIU84_013374 [Salix udensis]|uniref:Uncharacterized protein n=1 Tax=Salix udensis TaxID=889485 RepID=A0AAD6NUE0_9ROSI|nr:hypothetical protein OIU84_013374 [Salix udensis]
MFSPFFLVIMLLLSFFCKDISFYSKALLPFAKRGWGFCGWPQVQSLECLQSFEF